MREAGNTRAMVLLVTRNFPPLLGGMEKVNQQLLSALQVAWRTSLCGPTGCAVYAPPETETQESRVKPLPIFLIATLWRTILLALIRKPQWVVAGSGLTAPIAWFAARLAGGKVAVYLHGLDIVAPSRVYQWFWLPFIRRCDIALVNSCHTAQLAKCSGVRSEIVHVLHPGTDLPMLDAEAGERFRQCLGVGQRPMLLSIGRLTERKGLVEFVTRVLPDVVSSYPDVLLLIIGDEAVDALHVRTGSERERILNAARVADVEQNVRFLGRCDNATLDAAYQAADVHVFPVLDKPGDVEGFGMVALESAAHGLLTVAFAVGGVPDAVQDGHSGTLIEPGNYVEFSVTVNRLLSNKSDEIDRHACRKFAIGKAWPVFGARLRSILGAHHD